MNKPLPSEWYIELAHSLREFREKNRFYIFGHKKCPEECPLLRGKTKTPVCIIDHCIEMYPTTDAMNNLK